ncbi:MULTISPECIES: filament integrity protein FraC [unclassified Microcoleus]|uniref:filament integrity protein FraC n=1 Tax=unclassified Microcoleus TaxID=2642155 RepID=UPI002FCEAE15
MIASVFPFRTVLVQILIMFLAIAIESWFLQKLLKLGPKTSIEYTAILNLSCTCVGWLVFFGIESVLSKELREQLIGYILLGRGDNVYAPITMIALSVLAVTFLAKWQGLEFIENMVSGNKKASKPQFLGPPTLTRRPPKKTFQVTTQFGGILIAHTVSNIVILTVLFLQSVY